MPTFKEISSQETFPVVYSQHRDGTVLTAVKVPIDDVRLERWGWILSLSRKDGNSSQDGIVTLQDNNKQRYPKIYTTDEVSNYNEKHAYDSWEVGYNGQLNKIQSRRITTPLNTDMLQKEMLQETLENISSSQKELAQKLNDEFTQQNQSISTIVYNEFPSYFAKVDEMLDQVNMINGGVADAIEKNTETEEKILKANDEQKKIIVEGMEKLIEKMPALIYEEIKADFNASLQNLDKQLDIMDEELKEQLEQVQLKTSKTIQNSFIPLIVNVRSQFEGLNKILKEHTIESHRTLIKEIEDDKDNSEYILKEMNKSLKEQATQNHTQLTEEIKGHNLNVENVLQEQLGEIKNSLEENIDRQDKSVEEIKGHSLNVENVLQEQLGEIKSSLKENIDKQDKSVKELVEQIKKLLELTDIDAPNLEDGDLKISDKDDLVTVVTKTARKPTARIRKMANAQLDISNRYYDNVNEQSKRSFQIALILSVVGGIIFILAVAAVIITEALHIQRDPAILPIGTVISLLTEGLAGLNIVYERASKQFMTFHIFLDRIIRASIAHAITEEIKDETHRQQVIERIVENLLKEDTFQFDKKNHKSQTKNVQQEQKKEQNSLA